MAPTGKKSEPEHDFAQMQKELGEATLACKQLKKQLKTLIPQLDYWYVAAGNHKVSEELLKLFVDFKGIDDAISDLFDK